MWLDAIDICPLTLEDFQCPSEHRPNWQLIRQNPLSYGVAPSLESRFLWHLGNPTIRTE